RGVHRQAVKSGAHAMAIADLFDFNGVLVDDEDVHFEAFRRTLAAAGVTIALRVYRRFLGYDDHGTIVALLAHYDRRDAFDDVVLARPRPREPRLHTHTPGPE